MNRHPVLFCAILLASLAVPRIMPAEVGCAGNAGRLRTSVEFIIVDTVSDEGIYSRGRSGDELSITGVTVCGAFKNPFENRTAVLYGVRAWGEDESTGESRDFVSLHLSGCHLGIGFK